MVKKVAMFEKLKQGMLDEITVKVCDFLINDCDTCPKFISSRCKESCNEMKLRRLRTEAKIMANLEKLKQGMFDDMSEEAIAPKGTPKEDWRKLKEELCNEIGDCEKCPPSISKHCNEAFKAMKDWKKPQEPKDAPRGWIKLKAITNADDDTLYIKASTIACVRRSVNIDTIDGKTVTAVSTLYAEDDPWLVYDSIDEVMEKIEKA